MDPASQSDPVKLIVNILPKHAQAIQRMKEITGDSATDCVNRALGMYSYLLEQVLLPGHELYVKKKGSRRVAKLEITWVNPEYSNDDLTQ